MIDITTCTEEDLCSVKPMKVLEHEIPFLYNLKNCLKAPNCVSHSFKLGESVLGCMGAIMNKDGTMMVWGWFSDALKQYPFAFAKKTLMALQFYIKEFSPVEVIMYVLKGAESVVKWGNFLGFRKTNIVKGADGYEYYRMVRTV